MRELGERYHMYTHGSDTTTRLIRDILGTYWGHIRDILGTY